MACPFWHTVLSPSLAQCMQLSGAFSRFMSVCSQMFASTTAFNADVASWNMATVSNMSSVIPLPSCMRGGLIAFGRGGVVRASSRRCGDCICPLGWHGLPRSSWRLHVSLRHRCRSLWSCHRTLLHITCTPADPHRLVQPKLLALRTAIPPLHVWPTCIFTALCTLGVRSQMFASASAFNQNIASWNMASVSNTASVCSFSSNARGLMALGGSSSAKL
jgi:hypothetical protein